MSHYPQDFPAIEAKRLYSLASTGQLNENLIQATHDTWWVSGYLAKYAIGEPGEQPSSVPAIDSLTDAEKTDLVNLSVLAGTTREDLALPGEDPGKLLDNIDINKLLANIQSIIALLKVLGILA